MSVDPIDRQGPTESARVSGVRTRRETLREAMVALEQAVSGPGGKEGWIDQVAKALEFTGSTLREHIDSAEAEDGLFAEIGDMAPHLDPQIETMEKEHQGLIYLLEAAEQAAATAREDETGGAESVRRRVAALLNSLSEHRQLEADLVYDAYHIDISAAD